uniref:ADAM metallopeptidase with thrombospondin type 1 motif 16 n=1 Tax=Sinocyclocheilus grahami TaxID=75366 RepID=A0A672L280_SINGR
VDHQGRYVSHAVAHHHRRKRSTEGQDHDLAVHFRLRGLGQDFHLDLQPSCDLIAPSFTVQTLGRSGTKSLQPFPQDNLCFYHGLLRSEVNSSVALSTCAGMSGLIRTQDADYFLKPLHPHQALLENFSGPSDHHPHILYKRFTPAQTNTEEYQRTPHSHDGTQQRQHFCGRRKKYMPKPPEDDIYIFPDEYKFMPRGKRAIMFKSQTHQRLNVETLVVVDRKMMDNHGHENITTYVLTVLNMVSTLFKDGTIGGDINVVIVGLILLDEDQDGLVINHHADHTLNSFCQWQSGLAGREGRRHDHAILLTGLDICSWKNEPCDTLGFAPISGMCSKYRSCTINEDTGLGLAFTIAHESGHNFGMVHDGEGNVCKKSVGNIMSPTLAGHNGLFSWSSCSRQYLNRFLSTAQATCLSDEPSAIQEYKYPEKLPGELYDADTQCKWQFGEKAKLCTLDFKKHHSSSLQCHMIFRNQYNMLICCSRNISDYYQC